MGINVSTDELRSAANTIDSARRQLLNALDVADKAVGRVYNAWDSPAGTSYFDSYKRFTTSSTKACETVLTGFCGFLTAAANGCYDETERALKGYASKFD